MRYAIVESAIDLDALCAEVRSETSGAVVTFAGYVRARADDGRAVDGLDYEAHAELALAELCAIGDEALARFGATVAIAHRLGSLGVGEAAVGVAAAAAHRASAFDACEYAIDELKKRVAVWKRERYRDGAARWRENSA